MLHGMITRPQRQLIAAGIVALSAALGSAKAGLPDLPPFVPPPVVDPNPPIIVAPPVDPPPVKQTPEPGTLVLGGIAAGIAGWVARRRQRNAGE